MKNRISKVIFCVAAFQANVSSAEDTPQAPATPQASGEEPAKVEVSVSGSKTMSGTSETKKYSAKSTVNVKGIMPIDGLEKLVLFPDYFIEYEKVKKEIDVSKETSSSIGFGTTIVKYNGAGGGSPFVEVKVAEKDKTTESSGLVSVDDAKSLTYWTYGIEYKPENSKYLKFRFYRAETTNTHDPDFREKEIGVSLKFTLEVK